ncbi:MAG: hypothetical protein AABX03_02495 [Nanoarchaeota archaeon]
MSIRDLQGCVEDLIPVNNVLASVSDKTGLDFFIPALVRINPKIRFLSTGGTYNKIKEILGNPSKDTLLEVAEYTGFPEMEGGLVKTLHPKVHAGILGERGNPKHQRYLQEELKGAVFIDMAIVNLYPFVQTISKPDVTFEKARGNIDVGGPTMMRAAAKNFPSCASVCDPEDYQDILSTIVKNNGCTTFNQRFALAPKVFEMTSAYDEMIAKYFRENNDPEKVRELYRLN